MYPLTVRIFLLSKQEYQLKRKILMVAGLTGMLFGAPAVNANAEVHINIGSAPRPVFVIDRRPNFVELGSQGFSVSYGSKYDIILLNNAYYLNQGGLWYRASNYNGPWVVVRDRALPSRIRRHRMEDIRRFRDEEYRRNRSHYDGRDYRHDRRDWRDERRDERREDFRHDGPNR
jgi:hypothetical protein